MGMRCGSAWGALNGAGHVREAWGESVCALHGVEAPCRGMGAMGAVGVSNKVGCVGAPWCGGRGRGQQGGRVWGGWQHIEDMWGV